MFFPSFMVLVISLGCPVNLSSVFPAQATMLHCLPHSLCDSFVVAACGHCVTYSNLKNKTCSCLSDSELSPKSSESVYDNGSLT